MGNHSDTGELLEEARMVAITEGSASFGDNFVDEYGNTIKLDQSPEELANPTRLKDSSDRDVELIRNELPLGERPLTEKQYEAIQAKRKKKRAS